MYNEVLLEHNLHPEFRGQIEKIKPIKLTNSSCGDELIIYLKIQDGKITDGRFSGTGCAISQASADLFIKEILGKSREEAMKKRELFEKMLLDKITEKESQALGEIKALECVSKMPARVKCAKLAWESLEKL